MEIDMEVWAFIEENYYDYSGCDNVLKSDILTRFIENEEVEESDVEFIMENKPEDIEPKMWAKYQLMEVDKHLLQRAIEEKIGESLDF